MGVGGGCTGRPASHPALLGSGGGGHFEMTLVKAVEDAATALSLPQHPTGGQGVGQEAVGITGHVKGGGG